jgi:hypothetical protein
MSEYLPPRQRALESPRGVASLFASRLAHALRVQ